MKIKKNWLILICSNAIWVIVFLCLLNWRAKPPKNLIPNSLEIINDFGQIEIKSDEGWTSDELKTICKNNENENVDQDVHFSLNCSNEELNKYLSIQNKHLVISDKGLKTPGEYVFGIKAISDFNNKIVSKEKEIKAKIFKPIYPPQKITFQNLNDVCFGAINCGAIIQKFDFKMINDQHEDIFINRDLDITLHISSNNKTIDMKGNPILKIEKNANTNEYFIYLSEYVDQSYIGDYFLTITATSKIDKNIIAQKLIETKIIEGLEYKEDGITFTRKNQKDDWIATSVDKNVCEIKWGKDKRILGKKIKGFADRAAEDNTNLQTVILKNDLEFFGEYAFGWCTNLKELDVNVKEIKQSCFMNCYNLILPLIDNTEIIGDLVFCNCINIKRITLGKKCCMIGSSIFTCCNSLCTVTLNCEKPPIIANAIINCCKKFTLFIVNNKNLKTSDYLCQPNWCDLKQYF